MPGDVPATTFCYISNRRDLNLLTHQIAVTSPVPLSLFFYLNSTLPSRHTLCKKRQRGGRLSFSFVPPTMGNQHSSSHHDPLYTTAVANYMRLTKHKVILLQQAMERRRRRRNGTICQQHFCQALAEVKLHSTKDQDVLLNLFDLWDVQGTGRVPCDEFIIGLAPLACKRGESISTVLYFAMQLADVEGNGRISASETLLLLQSTYIFCAECCSFNISSAELCRDPTPARNFLP